MISKKFQATFLLLFFALVTSIALVGCGDSDVPTYPVDSLRSSQSDGGVSDAVDLSSAGDDATGPFTIAVTCGEGGSCAPATAVVSAGSTLAFTFTANAGYKVSMVILDGVILFDMDNEPQIRIEFAHTLSDIRHNHNFTVKFAATSSIDPTSSEATVSSSSVAVVSSSSQTVVNSSAGPVTSVGFDFTQSTVIPDGSMLTADASGEQSAKVEAKHKDGNWYPMAGWELKGDECPGGEGTCWWGWNDGDAITSEGFSVRVSIINYLQPDSWGYSNGGIIYIPRGTGLEKAEYVNIGTKITLKVKGASGKPIKIFLMDKASAGKAAKKASFAADGNWQTKTFEARDFKTPGENDSGDFTQVRAIAVEYELGAGTIGDDISKATGYPIKEAQLIWQSLKTE